MPLFTATELAQWTGGSWTEELGEKVGGFSIDSRQLEAGQLFVAIRAERDGHDFVEAAIGGGAVAVMVDHYLEEVAIPQLVVSDTVRGLQDCAREWRMRFEGTVIGLTGSCGKTSTKEILRQLLEGRGVYATEGNLNNYLGAALSILKLDSRKHRYGVIELGINCVGEMDRLAGMLRPDVGVVTMIGPAHLEGLGTVEGVAAEKVKMLESMGPSGFAVYPESCLAFEGFQRRRNGYEEDLHLEERVRSECYEARQFSTDYNKSESIDSSAWSIDSNSCAEGTIELQLPFGRGSSLKLKLGQVTKGMRMNWALGATVAAKLGIGRAEIEKVAENWKPEKNRGELIEVGVTRFFLDGYNANPASMIDSMDYFERRFEGEAKIWVIGGMHELGETSNTWHEKVGSQLRLGEEDRAIFVGEFGKALLKGAQAAGNDNARMERVGETGEVAEKLEGYRGIVFLKGSRFYRMERLVEAAKKREAEKC